MVKAVKWTKTALRDFDQIIQYLCDNWGEKVAAAFVAKTFALLDLLKRHPI
ncbi:MAG: type II toxin-antitoxin system RelE/ParE family toxin [Chitinophagales bacterium]|nr:type II toxin-antitoxin system RelE/ParE family toxin [Chitinophagales bacterium]